MITAARELPPLILASGSARRRELLAKLAVSFVVSPTDTDESVLPGERPEAYVQRVAAAKAAKALQTLGARPVLAADTAVVLGEQIFGKPRDRAHALEILERLSGRAHRVISAVAVSDGYQLTERLSITEVCFGDISAAEREAYWETGEPADKAGAYAIQGHGAIFVKAINGSYTGVVGLPLYETAELLRYIGYRPGLV
jgi:septum formation protein